MYTPKIQVLCAVRTYKFVGPELYEGIANAGCYLQLILLPLFRELTKEEKMYRYFLLVVTSRLDLQILTGGIIVCKK